MENSEKILTNTSECTKFVKYCSFDFHNRLVENAFLHENVISKSFFIQGTFAINN